MAVAEICRKGGFSDATFYKWRAKFGGMDASLMARLRELEDEQVGWITLHRSTKWRHGG